MTMFFKEYCEFIEALYCVRYSNINEEEKENSYKEIYDEYVNYGVKNNDFEEIFSDIRTGVARTLGELDLNFLKVYNGLLLSISRLLSLKIKLHYLENCEFITRMYPVENLQNSYHCLLCDNKNQELFFSFRTEQRKITYCKRCIEFGRCDNYFEKFHINIPLSKFKNSKKPSIMLSALQEDASSKILRNSLKSKKTLVWAVCGAGKTEIVYELIYDSLIKNKKVCMAIPRKDVVKELKQRVEKDFKNILINVLHGDEKTLVDSGFYIMTTHQLVKYYNYFDVVVIDEVDAFPYNGDGCLEEGGLSSLKKEGSLVFLSATPSEKVKNQVDEIIKIPIRYHRYLLPVPKIKLDSSKVFIYDKKSKIIMSFIERSLRKNRRILVFIPEIVLCEEVKRYLEKILEKNKVIEYVYSEDKKRTEKIERFHKWEIDILITTTILERGVTFDYLDILVFEANHKNFTKEALIQIAGRVGRKDYDSYGEIIFLAEKISKNMKLAIKEIGYMNELAKYRKLNKE